MAKIGQVDPR